MGSFPGGTVVRVKPTIIAGTTHDNDVMFDSTEIKNAVKNRGGVSKLVGLTIIDKDQESHDMEIIFMENQVNLGTAGSASSITDANLQLAKILHAFPIDWSDGQIVIAQDSGSAAVFSTSGLAGANDKSYMPLILKAAEGSTSVFFTAISAAEMAYAATDDLEFVFHIEYID
tara:strand:- start:276 stop:791 length:516 start_codon:yes stop_codon:yes gene_type:complete